MAAAQNKHAQLSGRNNCREAMAGPACEEAAPRPAHVTPGFPNPCPWRCLENDMSTSQVAVQLPPLPWRCGPGARK